MATRMKTDLYCQQQNCSPLNILFSDVYYIDIAGRYSARGLQSEYSER